MRDEATELMNIMGEPDGPVMFVDELDREVPTFIDPRDDLIPDGYKDRFKRLNHHVPFRMRGDYKKEQIPERAWKLFDFRMDKQGYVLCQGHNASGNLCGLRAKNRSGYCPSHGGGLHPADKVMASRNIMVSKAAPERLENLDRVQKFLSGIITADDLDDEEISGCYVRNNIGIPVRGAKLGSKFEAMLTKELHVRLNRFLRSKTPGMLRIMCDIAESDLVEAADRIKAIQWISERTMGKTPDVVIHGQMEQPYESIFENIESGSREEYRKAAIESAPILEAEVVECEVDDTGQIDADGDSGSDGISLESERAGLDINTGIPVFDPEQRAQEIIAKQKQAKELRDRVAKAKRRRYAARAQGVGLQGDVAWMIKFEPHPLGGRAFVGVLVPPEKQTKPMLDKLAATG